MRPESKMLLPRFSTPLKLKMAISPKVMGFPSRYPLVSALSMLALIWIIAGLRNSNGPISPWSKASLRVAHELQEFNDHKDRVYADMERRERIMTQKHNALEVLEADLILREKALGGPSTTLTVPPTKPKSLIVYVYVEKPEARRNFEFFISHAMHDTSDFIFVFNGETDAPSLLPNNPHSMYWDPRFKNGGGPSITVIKRDNTCFDLGAHSEVLLSEVDIEEGQGIENNWDMKEKIAAIEKAHQEELAAVEMEKDPETTKIAGRAVGIGAEDNETLATGKSGRKMRKGELWEQYSRFILMNASVRGPFMPFWSKDCWAEAFWSKITSKIKMVGMAYNCHEGAGHVQSMVWALDRAGLAAVLQRRPDGIGHWCPEDMPEAITGEIHATDAIRNAGFEVDVLTSVWHSRDALDIDADGNADGTMGYWRDCQDEDFFHDKAYYGFNVHPYETIFTKSARDMQPELLGNMTQWHDGSGYSSYEACKSV